MEPDQKTVEAFIAATPFAHQETARKLIGLIHSSFPALDAAIKWQQYTFGMNGDFHYWIAALKHTQKGIMLYFHYGGLLDDPNGVLEKGSSDFLRKIACAAPGDVNVQTITEMIGQAVSKLDLFKTTYKEKIRKQ